MYATLFLALATSVLAAPIVQRGKPSDWATGYLENYDTCEFGTRGEMIT